MAYKLMVSIVLPRPIALVTTVSAQGVLNAAPFSFFNAMGSEPPVVVLGFEPKPNSGCKDTPTSILETRQLVVNMVDEALSIQMNECSSSQSVDELVLTGLETVESMEVKPLRIKAAPASMECKLMNTTRQSVGGCIVMPKYCISICVMTSFHHLTF